MRAVYQQATSTRFKWAEQLKHGRGLFHRDPGGLPPALELVSPVEEDIIPSAFIVQQEIRYPRSEKFLTVLLAPDHLRILIVLPKAHGFAPRA